MLVEDVSHEKYATCPGTEGIILIGFFFFFISMQTIEIIIMLYHTHRSSRGEGDFWEKNSQLAHRFLQKYASEDQRRVDYFLEYHNIFAERKFSRNLICSSEAFFYGNRWSNWIFLPWAPPYPRTSMNIQHNLNLFPI